MSGNFVDRFVKPGQRPAESEPATAPAPPPPEPVQVVADNVIPMTAPEEVRAAPAAPSGKEPYQAFGEHKVKKRSGGMLRMYYGKNRLGQALVGSNNYSYLTEIIATSDRFISIVFTNVVITLEGENLTRLYDALEEQKIHWLQCFDKDRHSPPAAGVPHITGITRESLGEFMRGGAKQA